MQPPISGRHSASPVRPPSVPDRPRRNTTATTLIAIVGALILVGGALAVRAQLGQSATLESSTAASAPMFGASIISTSDLAQDTSNFGHMAIVRVYYPGLPSANAWTSGLAAANHSAVIVSFNAEPSAILSGSDDAVLSHFFDTAPTGHPIYYSYIHEPEGHIQSGEFTLAAYKSAWAHIVALADAANNSSLRSTLILQNYDFAKSANRDWKDYLPGGNIISTLGWDAYPVGSALNVNPQPTPPDQFMGQAIAASKSVGLPYGFAEFSLSTPVGRPAWLTEVGNYLMSSGALFATYYNTNVRYPSDELTSPSDVAVWRSFVQGSSGPLQPPPPSPAPSPAPAGPVSPTVTNLKVTPSAFAETSGANTAITFTLSEGANVTACILDSNGSVQRMIAKPGRAAGQVTIPFYGYNGSGHYLPAGGYEVLVVASNANGSGTAEIPLTISSP